VLLGSLGVVPSDSRPQVSDDNPFYEAQLKTLKYRPDFPARFGAYEDAEAFCQRFFPWYNIEHRHSALGLMTPHDIHYGLAEAKWQHHAAVLHTAYEAHPERFPRGAPVPPPLPTAAWINKPPATPVGGRQVQNRDPLHRRRDAGPPSRAVELGWTVIRPWRVRKTRRQR
jgi:putative transposase